MKRTLTITGEVARKAICNHVLTADEGDVVTIGPPVKRRIQEEKYHAMIGDIADRTPGASKHDILNAVGSDSRVGKKCVSLLVPELELIVFSLQVLASWVWFWWPLLPSRQPCVGRLRQDGRCAASAP